MPKFDGVIGLIGFLILAYLLFSQAAGADKIFGSIASNGSKLVTVLQGR